MRRTSFCSLVLGEADQLIPSAASITWPHMSSKILSRQQHTDTDGLKLDDIENVWKRGMQIWIRQHDLELQINIMVCSRSRSVGHRGMMRPEVSLARPSCGAASIRTSKRWFARAATALSGEPEKSCTPCRSWRSSWQSFPRGFLVHGPGVEQQEVLADLA